MKYSFKTALSKCFFFFVGLHVSDVFFIVIFINLEYIFRRRFLENQLIVFVKNVHSQRVSFHTQISP